MKKTNNLKGESIMHKLILKVSDCEFEIKFNTSRKTCPMCNGTGQIMDWDYGVENLLILLCLI